MTKKKSTGFYIPPEELIPMVERLQRGEKEIGDEIMTVFYKKVLGHILKMEKDFAQAEEIAENVFIEADRQIGKLQNPTAFVSWLNRITIAVCNNHRRKVFQKKKKDEKDKRRRSEPAYKRRKWTEEEKEILRCRLTELPPKQAEIMKLHYVDGKTVEEISACLGIPEGTVKSRLHYGRLKFQTLIKPEISVQTD